MSTRHLILRWRALTFIDHFLIAIFLVAACNFLEVFFITARAASDAGSYSGGGYTLTACYLGPPVPYYPRFWIALSLGLASIAAFGKSLGRRILVVIGLAFSLLMYIAWWSSSYRVSGNFADSVNSMMYFRANQTFYLYQGTWTDVSVAISVVVCLVLMVERVLLDEALNLSVPRSRS